MVDDIWYQSWYQIWYNIWHQIWGAYQAWLVVDNVTAPFSSIRRSLIYKVNRWNHQGKPTVALFSICRSRKTTMDLLGRFYRLTFYVNDFSMNWNHTAAGQQGQPSRKRSIRDITAIAHWSYIYIYVYIYIIYVYIYIICIYMYIYIYIYIKPQTCQQ